MSRITRNVFVDCRMKVCDYDGSVMKLLQILEIADNLAIHPKGSKEGSPAPGLKAFAIAVGTPEKPLDPGFANPAAGDFQHKPGSLPLQRVPSFQPIPVTGIGLLRD